MNNSMDQNISIEDSIKRQPKPQGTKVLTSKGIRKQLSKQSHVKSPRHFASLSYLKADSSKKVLQYSLKKERKANGDIENVSGSNPSDVIRFSMNKSHVM